MNIMVVWVQFNALPSLDLLVLFSVPGSVTGSIAMDRLISLWFVTVLGTVFSSYYEGTSLKRSNQVSLMLNRESLLFHDLLRQMPEMKPLFSYY
ncbi:MAG: hypothetical protein RBT32_00365 [Methanothermobacter sp.]|nr:hypothetical protein [Methanothermobacter sp.]